MREARCSECASAGRRLPVALPLTAVPAQEMFQRKKEAKRADAASDTPGSSIQCQSGSVQCDYLWEWYLGGKGAQMSALEMQDRPLPQQFITMKGSRTELAALPPLIERHLPKCKKLFQFNKMARQPRGAPYVLIVCSSAIRCVNFLKCAPYPAARLAPFASSVTLCWAARRRHLARFRANCVKLFAKHIKTSEQKQALTMFTPIGVGARHTPDGPLALSHLTHRPHSVPHGAGTPARIHSLAQAGVLSLDHLRLLVVDVAADAKKRTLFDMKDVQEAWGELYHAHLHHALTTPFSTKGDAAVPPPTARPRARQAGEGAERTGAEGRPIAVLY